MKEPYACQAFGGLYYPGHSQLHHVRVGSSLWGTDQSEGLREPDRIVPELGGETKADDPYERI